MSSLKNLLNALDKGKLKVKAKKVNIPDYKNPTDVQVTNLTITGKISDEDLDLMKIFKNISTYDPDDRGIIGMQTSKGDFKGLVKKIKPKKKAGIKKPKTKRSEAFLHCISFRIVPSWYTDIYNTSRKKFKEINCKLFINGATQLTGCRSRTDGIKVQNFLMKKIKKALDGDCNLELTKNKVGMVNSKFNTHFCINRNVLHDILKEKYHLTVRLNASKYQALIVRYFYNEINEYSDGICHCKCEGKKCPGIGDCNGKCTTSSCAAKYNKTKKNKDKKAGKGTGDGLNECKCVSIFVFRTGNILITGGNSYHQVNVAYDFINKLIKKHYTEIYQEPVKKE